jgi:putative solute:sodium symporter small subunit
MAEAAPERERREPESTRRSRGYWRANLRLQLTLLAVWALFGYVLAILFADPLNDVSFGGFPLGFWFAQQGAIYVFVLLIFIYAITMDRVDHEFGVQEEELGWARKRAERRMQRGLTGEAPAAEAELGEPTGEETRRDNP